jgi:transcriptional regulator with XRE-family HTH domain
MPGATLRAWRAEMGLSECDAAARLGMSRGGLRNAEALGAPLYIALACAAVIRKLEPYGVDEQ